MYIDVNKLFYINDILWQILNWMLIDKTNLSFKNFNMDDASSKTSILKFANSVFKTPFHLEQCSIPFGYPKIYF